MILAVAENEFSALDPRDIISVKRKYGEINRVPFFDLEATYKAGFEKTFTFDTEGQADCTYNLLLDQLTTLSKERKRYINKVKKMLDNES